MKIYLASAYSRQSEMREIAARLIAAGHEITARWIDEAQTIPPGGLAEIPSSYLAEVAQVAVDDVAVCSCLVSVTGPGTTTGGRHVEHGIALALGKRLVVLGDLENVFHHLPKVEQVGTVDELLALLSVTCPPGTHRVVPRAEHDALMDCLKEDNSYGALTDATEEALTAYLAALGTEAAE